MHIGSEQHIHLIDRVHQKIITFLDSRSDVCGIGGANLLNDALRRSSRGGKMVRPSMLLMAATSQGLQHSEIAEENAVTAAAAFEMLHTGFLIQDDVMDEDLLRRGSPTLVVYFNEIAERTGNLRGKHFGESAATLVADLAITGAYRLMSQAGELSGELIQILDEAVTYSAQGQYADIENRGDDVLTQDEVFKLARYKTGAYSFEAPVAAGTLIAGLDDDASAHLAWGARHMGIAFQVRDDLLGIQESEMNGAKGLSCSDLRFRKHTILTAYLSKNEDFIHYWHALGEVREPSIDIERAVRRLFWSSGAVSYAEKTVERLESEAEKEITHPTVPAALSSDFLTFFHSLRKRIR